MVIDLTISGTTRMFSTGSAVVITVEVCSVFFLIIGVLVGALCGHWTTLYRLGKQKQPGYVNSPLHQLLQLQSVKNLHHMEGKHLELKENILYET